MARVSATDLRLAPVWPALAALLVTAALGTVLLPGAIAAEAARELEQTVRLLLPALPAPDLARGEPERELQARVAALVAGTSYRLTLIAADGRVLADSELPFEALAAAENHRGRAEVAAALADGDGHAVRTSATTGLETAYAARRVRAPDGGAYVARLGLPIGALARFRRHLAGMLALSALAAAAVAGALSLALSRILFRPLARLIAAADRIGGGDYRVAVEAPAQAELAKLAHALRRTAREAERQLAALEAERDHLAATVESMSEGVLVVAPDGAVQLANRSFRELFGLPPEEPAAELLALAREAKLGELVADATAGGAAGAVRIERGDPPRALAALATRLRGERGALIVVRDVTEAERLDRVRTDFVANVSHELKTPLAAIRGCAETLVDGALDERATALRFSERILEQCRRLEELLDDLLTLSRLESPEPLRAPERVDLAELAREAVELVAARAAAKPVTLELEPGAAPAVEGDWESLLRLLTNLLDNAIKYNRPGGAVAVRLGERDSLATIEVADTGIGVPPAHRARIFERFYRVDTGRAREEGGTGLGLAIVKHVAQAHRGRVEVESEPGVGSTFRVLLPAAG